MLDLTSNSSTDLQEEWKWAVGYEGLYEVSNMGRVRSYVRYKEGRLLKPGAASHGYLTVVLYSPSRGKGLTRTVHSLVLEAFVGPRPEGHEVCHKDGNRKNASLSNLKWGTPAENQRDKVLHKTFLYGETASNAKLSKEDVHCIRHLLNRGIVHRVIAEWFGVSRTTVTNISQGDTWGFEERLLSEVYHHESDKVYKPKAQLKTVH